MSIPTRKEVIEHFQGTFVLNDELTQWIRGEVTWEEAMMISLLKVDEERKSLLSTIYTMKRDAHLSKKEPE